MCVVSGEADCLGIGRVIHGVSRPIMRGIRILIIAILKYRSKPVPREHCMSMISKGSEKNEDFSVR